jgi:hypothetical protein
MTLTMLMTPMMARTMTAMMTMAAFFRMGKGVYGLAGEEPP